MSAQGDSRLESDPTARYIWPDLELLKTRYRIRDPEQVAV
jgi:hypothetical protein